MKSPKSKELLTSNDASAAVGRIIAKQTNTTIYSAYPTCLGSVKTTLFAMTCKTKRIEYMLWVGCLAFSDLYGLDLSDYYLSTSKNLVNMKWPVDYNQHAKEISNPFAMVCDGGYQKHSSSNPALINRNVAFITKTNTNFMHSLWQ